MLPGEESCSWQPPEPSPQAAAQTVPRFRHAAAPPQPPDLGRPRAEASRATRTRRRLDRSPRPHIVPGPKSQFPAGKGSRSPREGKKPPREQREQQAQHKGTLSATASLRASPSGPPQAPEPGGLLRHAGPRASSPPAPGGDAPRGDNAAMGPRHGVLGPPQPRPPAAPAPRARCPSPAGRAGSPPPRPPLPAPALPANLCPPARGAGGGRSGTGTAPPGPCSLPRSPTGSPPPVTHAGLPRAGTLPHADGHRLSSAAARQRPGSPGAAAPAPRHGRSHRLSPHPRGGSRGGATGGCGGGRDGARLPARPRLPAAPQGLCPAGTARPGHRGAPARGWPGRARPRPQRPGPAAAAAVKPPVPAGRARPRRAPGPYRGLPAPGPLRSRPVPPRPGSSVGGAASRRGAPGAPAPEPGPAQAGAAGAAAGPLVYAEQLSAPPRPAAGPAPLGTARPRSARLGPARHARRSAGRRRMPSPPPAPPAPPPHRRRRALRNRRAPPRPPAGPCSPRAPPAAPPGAPREPGPLPLALAWGEPPSAETGHGPGLCTARPLSWHVATGGCPCPPGTAHAHRGCPCPLGAAHARRGLPVPTRGCPCQLRAACAHRGCPCPPKWETWICPGTAQTPRGPQARSRGASTHREGHPKGTSSRAPVRPAQQVTGRSVTQGWQDTSLPGPARSRPGSRRSRGCLNQASRNSTGLRKVRVAGAAAPGRAWEPEEKLESSSTRKIHEPRFRFQEGETSTKEKSPAARCQATAGPARQQPLRQGEGAGAALSHASARQPLCHHPGEPSARGERCHDREGSERRRPGLRSQRPGTAQTRPEAPGESCPTREAGAGARLPRPAGLNPAPVPPGAAPPPRGPCVRRPVPPAAALPAPRLQAPAAAEKRAAAAGRGAAPAPGPAAPRSTGPPARGTGLPPPAAPRK
ncbi:basic proline-rich protein-like [Nyctibius grandis]|uniref:basic proline-rich protein-like n=1 Tax=Nyctibius grandis TaxID=48427 RepID=UPI0035BC32FE